MMIMDGPRGAMSASLPKFKLSAEESLLKCLERFQVDRLGRAEAASMQRLLQSLEVMPVDEVQKRGFSFQLNEMGVAKVRKALESWRLEGRRAGVMVFLLDEEAEVAAAAIMTKSEVGGLVVMGDVFVIDQKKALAEEFSSCSGYFLANLCMTSVLDQTVGPVRITRGGGMGTGVSVWKDETGEMYFRSVPNLDMEPPHQYTEALTYPEVLDVSRDPLVLAIR